MKMQPPQDRLTQRFGRTVLKRGYTCLPNLLLERQAELHINPTQMNIMMQIWSVWWEEEPPHPPLSMIARRIGRGVRCIQINLRKMEKPLYSKPKLDEEGNEVEPVLLRPALLIRIPRSDERGSLPSAYDFSPLLEMLEALSQTYIAEETPAPPEEVIPPQSPPTPTQTTQVKEQQAMYALFDSLFQRIHGPNFKSARKAANDAHIDELIAVGATHKDIELVFERMRQDKFWRDHMSIKNVAGQYTPMLTQIRLNGHHSNGSTPSTEISEEDKMLHDLGQLNKIRARRKESQLSMEEYKQWLDKLIKGETDGILR